MSKIKNSDTYKTAYNSLNKAQRQAVDTIDGPVMVIAGPGTGKTQILTLRIANILESTDTSPDSILALTFTESGATAMRERLRRYIGATAYQVPIFTFHGFASELIRSYPEMYERIIGAVALTELERISCIEQILDNPDFKLLRPSGSPTYYVPSLIGIISDLKRENITPADFAKKLQAQEADLEATPKVHEKGAHKGKVRGEYLTKEKDLAKNRELHQVYLQYQALLESERKFDFEDMILETIKALEANEDMRLSVQERFQYVLADEHQDVNGAQNKILELITSHHEQPNIFVVGDEKQAIYRFQGASLENFLYFEDAYPNTTIISLTDNYRSGQTILDYAHSLVAVEDGPLKDLRVALTAAAKESGVITQKQFEHQAVEDAALVADIEAKVAGVTNLSDIAVIVRTNREVEAITKLLRQAGVAATASAEGDILQHTITQQVKDLITVISKPEDAASLFRVLHGAYWGISVTDLLKVCSAQTYQEPLPTLLFDEIRLKKLGLESTDSVLKIKETITAARTRMVSEAPAAVLAAVLEESGFLSFVMEHDPHEGARVVRRMYDEIESLHQTNAATTLSDVVAMFTTLQAYNLPLNAPYIAHTESAVQVMTAHKSKGLEFPVVYLPHLTDNQWGGTRRRELFKVQLTKHVHDVEKLDDERRLLYVALTRAKSEIMLSSAETNQAGKDLLPSRLLEEMDDTKVEAASTTKFAEDFSVVADLKPTPKHPIDAQFLHTILQERGFSATSLNNYLKSPWDYLYRNVLRIPEVQPVHMQYGTAVHAVLEKTTALYTKEKKLPSITELKKQFDTALGVLPLTTEDFTRLHEKGMNAMVAYFPHLESTIGVVTREEMKLKVVLKTGIPELPELPLTGMLDRIDFGEDGNAIRVVDYKTGKARTRNAIEGKTASDDGGYKRQLVFYRLLLELHEDERLQTRDMTLSFVEPNAKGEVKEETFTITDEEVVTLKEEIITAVKEIISGECLSAPCEEGESEYCHLVEMLKEV